MFGPTTGDRVRLADTELFIEVEKDFTVFGEEVKFGGGKVIRDGMGQSQVTRAAGAVDTVITNALVVDATGIYKADVGLKGGGIAAIGKAGNPDTQPGVTIIASIPTPQPVHYRPMFVAYGKAITNSSVTFVSKAALDAGLREKIGIDKQLLAVENTRGGIGKRSTVLNDATPHVEVDPETSEVRADGEILTCPTATVLPMAQRYFLF